MFLRTPRVSFGQDNTAAEGLLTLQDGAWETPKLMRKSAKYNWTVDACNLWGAILTANFWVRGGNHTFSRSLSGKWLQIAVVGSAANFIYVVQPGDVVKHKDGVRAVGGQLPGCLLPG